MSKKLTKRSKRSAPGAKKRKPRRQQKRAYAFAFDSIKSALQDAKLIKRSKMDYVKEAGKKIGIVPKNTWDKAKDLARDVAEKAGEMKERFSKWVDEKEPPKRLHGLLDRINSF